MIDTVQHIKQMPATVLLWMIALVSVAQQGVKAEFLTKVLASYENTQTLKSKFTQVRTIAIMQDKLVAEGMFYYEKPGRVKWDQALPEPYYFLINEKEVVRFDGKKRQKLPASSPQTMFFKEFILGIVNGKIFEDARFSGVFTRNDDEMVVVLTPRDNKLRKKINKIEMHFDANRMVLNLLLITDKNGDLTHIHFYDQQVNAMLTEDTFQ